ncbi:hypothetical protein [Pseudovibrio ascidiaceicola]|uniref:hypothetical protein n=1 Tax=Pseudovibrio ascidiaceicola TaxID=285279 RepID=UPI000AC8F956|nr:hypothetical protein [Pseudovibrio ascidiaceicola]
MQTQLLKALVEVMPKGGTFAMIAHVLKQRNPTAQIPILDPKEKFSKQGLFMEGWENHYAGWKHCSASRFDQRGRLVSDRSSNTAKPVG